MRRPISLLFILILILSACGSSPSTPASNSPAESSAAGAFSGVLQTTYIRSEGSDQPVAVMVASPKYKRYGDGAGILVIVPPIFTPVDGFMRDPDVTSVGLIQVSYLWPGGKDRETGAKSEGVFDHGGPNSIKILRDVLRFAGGRLADIHGRYVFGLTRIPPLTSEVGLYAFSDAGLAAVKALSLYGDQYQGFQYYIGRETPTSDSLASQEIGYYDASGQPVLNPFYNYPESYRFNSLRLVYTNLRWDASYHSSLTGLTGFPYLDLDSSGAVSSGDYVFEGHTPVLDGKRYFSISLTQSLQESGALSQAAWPDDVATPAEASTFWAFFQNEDRFSAMQNEAILRNLKVMLVFGLVDQAQPALDKPHIHQAYQGFRTQARRLWVRLNPDRAYVEDMLLKYTPATNSTPVPLLSFPDTPANTEPPDWAGISSEAYPTQGVDSRLIVLAAVEEMADRAHTGDWTENLGQALTLYLQPSPTP